MPYWRLFYHLVWGTKNREPLISPEVEPALFGFLRKKAIGLGATVYVLNGTHDHVHIVVSIPPNIAISKFVGQVKAVASTRMNQSRLFDIPFYWQHEYGVFSFDRKKLEGIIRYVEDQKKHHDEGTIIKALEMMTADGEN